MVCLGKKCVKEGENLNKVIKILHNGPILQNFNQKIINK
jgi:hypothetical protein